MAGHPNAGPVRLPDVVLIDGGKGQVAMAREVFAEWGPDGLHRRMKVKPQGGLEELVFSDGRAKVTLLQFARN